MGRFAPRWNMRFRRTGGHDGGPDLRPGGEAAAHENAAAFQVSSRAVQLDGMLAESFVGFDGTLRDGQAYARFRGFFLPDSARSRLRR